MPEEDEFTEEQRALLEEAGGDEPPASVQVEIMRVLRDRLRGDLFVARMNVKIAGNEMLATQRQQEADRIALELQRLKVLLKQAEGNLATLGARTDDPAMLTARMHT